MEYTLVTAAACAGGWFDPLTAPLAGDTVFRESLLFVPDPRTGQTLPCDLLVLAVGVRPNTALAESAGAQVNRGITVSHETMETTVPGIFAAGDIRAKPFRQIITAASDGAIAAHSAAEYISNLKADGGK